MKINAKLISLIIISAIIGMALYIAFFTQVITKDLENKQNQRILQISQILEKYPEAAFEVKKVFLDVDNNNQIRKTVIKEEMKLLFFACIIILIISVIVWFFIRNILVKRIYNIIKISENISKGDISARIMVEKSLPEFDEIDELAFSFNEMADNISDLLEKIDNNQNFLQRVIDGIPDGIRVIDDDYNIIAANGAYSKSIGKTLEQILKMKCYQAQNHNNPCNPAVTPCPYIEIKKQNKPLKIITNFNKGNGLGYVQISAAPIIINDKHYIIESIRDLSDDIRFSHIQKLSALGMISSSIAHEMRNPLGSIKLIVEGMLSKFEKNKLKDKELKDFLSLIKEQLEICIGITGRLLDMAKTGENKDILYPVNLNKAISDTVLLLDYEAKKNGVKISLDLSKDLDILANNSEIRIVLLNIIQNAFHSFEKDGGEIEISGKSVNKNIIIKIKDNGKGIEKDKLKNIFEPFFSTRKNELYDSGTGLGLTITKDIIHKFGGKIEVKSKIGIGTAFILNLPNAKKS